MAATARAERMTPASAWEWLQREVDEGRLTEEERRYATVGRKASCEGGRPPVAAYMAYKVWEARAGRRMFIYELCVNREVVGQFMKQMFNKKVNYDYEHSELLLYQNMVIR